MPDGSHAKTDSRSKTFPSLMTTPLTTRWLWIIAAAGAGAVIAVTVVWQAGLITRDRYLAVYLQTGDIYFGKQVGFWGFILENVWFFERRQDGSLVLVPISNAAWHPREPIHISRDQVVFWAYLDFEGQIAQAIAGRLPASPPNQQSLLPNAKASGTSRFSSPQPAR